MIDILEKIAANKRIEVEQLKIELPLEILRERPTDPRRDFKAALSHTGIRIIAEIKKGSPSKGIMSEHFDPVALAEQYQNGGAAALSVLTDQRYFYGSFENLSNARNAVSLPVLCKDFMIDPYQIYYARYRTADAILLIVALLGRERAGRLLDVAREVGIDALVEVHDEAELDIALDIGADIIGINNRNLRDFSVNLSTCEKLAERIPDSVVTVAESGIESPGDIRRLKDAGLSAYLIGETLVRSDDPSKLLKEMIES